MTAPPRPRRRLTIATLLALIAAIAVGLFGTIRVPPWWRLRKAHPELATVRALVSDPHLADSCFQCHSKAPVAMATPPAGAFEHVFLAGQPTPSAASNCKACHPR